MSRPTNYNKRFSQLLDELIKEYPEVGLGRHLDTALGDYGPLWSVSAKELCYALEKYKSELALDVLHVAPEDYVKNIVEDATHMFDEIEEEDEDNGY